MSAPPEGTLGAEEIAATRAAIGWLHPAFEIPEQVRNGWDAKEAGKRAERRWKRIFASYQKQNPADAAEFARRMKGDLPADFPVSIENLLKETAAKAETVATRKASQNVLEAIKPGLPELLGG